MQLKRSVINALIKVQYSDLRAIPQIYIFFNSFSSKMPKTAFPSGENTEKELCQSQSF